MALLNSFTSVYKHNRTKNNKLDTKYDGTVSSLRNQYCIMIKIAPTTIHSGWCHRIIVYINSKYCSISLCMDLMYICSNFYHEVLLASIFTNLHNYEHL